MYKNLLIAVFTVSLLVNPSLVCAQDFSDEDPEEPTTAADYALITSITRLDEIVYSKLDCEGADNIEKYTQDVNSVVKKVLKANQSAAKFDGLAPKELSNALKDEAQFLVEDCDLIRSGGGEEDDPVDDFPE